MPIIAALSALAVLTSTMTLAYAQYGGTGGSIGTASPEQLQECEQLGVPRENCNDVTILAKKRLTAAQENPATGSVMKRTNFSIQHLINTKRYPPIFK